VLIASSHFLSDSELVTCAQSGDPSAVNALIASVRPAVLRYCRSRLTSYGGGWHAADDAAQETCVAVVQVLPNYQPRGGAPFTAFVYAIAANKVADAQRRFSRSAICVEDVPDRVEPAPTPEEQAVISARADAVHQLLDQLPERMRELLLLRAAGASADVVGDKLGMSANAVRVAQHRAVAKLRHLIELSDEHREFLDSSVSRSRTAA
jgi:RNA polymerase sigma-70 factor (ECF subfamily)